MSEYTLALILIAQPVIIFINRNKRKLADDVVTKQPVFHQATVPPIPAKNIFEQPPVSPIGKKNIFINYRKEDSSGYSLALYHELIKWYHKDTIFKDFNTIEPGEDFEEAINSALNGASVLIVIMADKWHDILQMRGQKKHKDFVRIEIATALAKNIYTIPVTINSTVMPTEEELPEDLVKLSHRQFLNIDQTRFETDILKLVKIIDGRLGIKRS
ncbi:MAG: toll/interleukin-1 receptor domain-containing protein [Ferruginibacter sp.]